MNQVLHVVKHYEKFRNRKQTLTIFRSRLQRIDRSMRWLPISDAGITPFFYEFIHFVSYIDDKLQWRSEMYVDSTSLVFVVFDFLQILYVLTLPIIYHYISSIISTLIDLIIFSSFLSLFFFSFLSLFLII